MSGSDNKMKLSVACNFDPELVRGLEGYPVYEMFGKITADAFGGGRPSFYLPEVDRQGVERYAELCRQRGIEFNYLLNASCMGNTEFTREGQKEFEAVMEWISSAGIPSVTVATLHFLRFIKRRYPKIKVKISSHRFTDTPRKVRFWQENGADCIVISEVNIYREFRVLEAMRKAATSCDLQLIVNNFCRQDCAIAGTHAECLNHASQDGSAGVPLDYCFISCMDFRLREPVNYLRANWIRPEDLHHYMKIGYNNFKIVERNCPTQILLERVKAYYNQHYDGNLLDLVQNHAYPYEKFSPRERDAYSLRRMLKYFMRPMSMNMLKFVKVMDLGKRASLLYPRQGENEVWVDNRALDGFLDRFLEKGCQDVDCNECLYCHEWAEKAVRISPAFKEEMSRLYSDLLDDIHSGSFWEDHRTTVMREIKETAAEVIREGVGSVLVDRPLRGIRHLARVMPDVSLPFGAERWLRALAGDGGSNAG